jgi:hypothetical protein
MADLEIRIPEFNKIRQTYQEGQANATKKGWPKPSNAFALARADEYEI